MRPTATEALGSRLAELEAALDRVWLSTGPGLNNISKRIRQLE